MGWEMGSWELGIAVRYNDIYVRRSPGRSLAWHTLQAGEGRRVIDEALADHKHNA